MHQEKDFDLSKGLKSDPMGSTSAQVPTNSQEAKCMGSKNVMSVKHLSKIHKS